MLLHKTHRSKQIRLDPIHTPIGAASVLPSPIIPASFANTITNARNRSARTAAASATPTQISDTNANDGAGTTDNDANAGSPTIVEDNSSSLPRWVTPANYRVGTAPRDRNKG